MTAEQAISWLTLKPKNLPVFVLIGTDLLAPDVIEQWILQAFRAGVTIDKIQGARIVKDEFMNWPEKKLPG